MTTALHYLKTLLEGNVARTTKAFCFQFFLAALKIKALAQWRAGLSLQDVPYRLVPLQYVTERSLEMRLDPFKGCFN